MSVPTSGETYARLMEHIRKAQEESAMMAHLSRDNDAVRAKAWLDISELFRRMQHRLRELAIGRAN